ncbi:hypothetical protein EBR96_04185 [bacterium]|nr:hypothetical protein [bacterium]
MKYLPYQKIVVMTLILAGFFAPIYGETLTTITDEPTAQVFVNGILVGEGATVECKLQPGTYQVKVVRDSTPIFVEMIDVQPSRNQTVAIKNFVSEKSILPNRASKQLEADRFQKNLGQVGFGFHWGNVDSGLSLNWFVLPNFAVETTGWYSLNGPDNQIKSFSLAAKYYVFQSTSGGGLVMPYIGGRWGFADVTEKNSLFGTGDVRSDYRQSITEAVVGLDVSSLALKGIANSWLNSQSILVYPGFVLSVVSALDNNLSSFEIGLENYERAGRNEYTGITFNFGSHWYF